MLDIVKVNMNMVLYSSNHTPVATAVRQQLQVCVGKARQVGYRWARMCKQEYCLCTQVQCL